MKPFAHFSICAAAALLTSACSLVNNPHSEPPPPAPQVQAAPPLQGQYAMGGDCRAQAENRLALINKPSTYPLSDQEKNNALIALYSECTHQQQVVDMRDPSQDAARFASLAPAAGGNMQPRPLYTGNTGVAAGSGVVVIRGNDASQFAALSPASGGLPAEAYAAVPPGAYANAYGNYAGGPSVVVVESGSATPAPQQVVARPVVATPVPPLATAYAPVMAPASPVKPHSSLGANSNASGSLPPVASAAPARPRPSPASPPVPLNGSDPQQLEDILLKN